MTKLTPSAVQLLSTRYISHGESVGDIFPRVATTIAKHTPGANGSAEKYAARYLTAMNNLDFLPNSPCIRNAGYMNMNKACLTGDTVIHCAQGDYTIYDLATKDWPWKHLYVFSRDEQGNIRCSEATRPILTRKSALILKVIFDTGHSIRITEDHLIMMRDGTFKEARCLQAGMSVMPFTFYRDKHQHRQILFDDGKFYPAYRTVYRDVIGEISERHAIHHKDENGANDDPNNLDQMSQAKHTSLHMKGNTHCKGILRSKETRKRMSAAQLKHHQLHPVTDIEKQKISEATRRRFEDPKEREKISTTLKARYNHKILSISSDGYEDVYDIEFVNIYHNFAANGVFVHNCFVLPIEDSIDGIFGTLHKSALIFKYGGGCGYLFSDLRERGAALNAGGESSGMVSFMKLYDASTEIVKQGGFRRGASMGVAEYDHPEIIDFIQAKVKHGILTNFNVSVLVDDSFMKRIETGDSISLKSRIDRRKTTGQIKACDLFNLITLYAWDNGDPGLLFFDRINRDNPQYPAEAIRATNPCGEVPLFPYESCCLGSINLSNCITSDGELDVDKLDELVELATFFLMGMNKSSKFPLKECYEMQNKYFRLGLGVMGFADLLLKTHIFYDSHDTLVIIDKIGKRLKKAARYAPLSVATLSIAPTGSLSIIANCSSGIEPVFAPAYERHITDAIVTEKRDSEYLRTAHQVSPDWHLKIQARWQQYIDNGVSKTVNLPFTASQGDVAKIYMDAWKMGCKGITVYRDGCRGPQGQVYRQKCEGETCTL